MKWHEKKKIISFWWSEVKREKTVFWPKKQYFVKNNEGEGANCIAANLSFKKKYYWA